MSFVELDVVGIRLEFDEDDTPVDKLVGGEGGSLSGSEVCGGVCD